ncbi:MAG: RNA-guided endonuclease IscB [Alkaliphilus sp.]
MVYVISVGGKPLMPTNNAKARILLNKGKARVLTNKPFTIMLTYELKSHYTQPITLGIDSGYLNIGFSATTEKEELIGGEVNLLKGMKERISNRAMYRMNRRRKLRYRKPRFDNRKKEKGWLAPSIRHKLDSHLRFIESLTTVLPITEIIVEVANFDIQKIKDPDIKGEEYQQGEQLGFWNTREYVLHRDNHKCHTTPNHKKGKFLYEWQTNKPKLKSFKDVTFMTIVRWKLLNTLNEKYPKMRIHHTYGYTTKNNRTVTGLSKSHHNDAFVIANGTKSQNRISSNNFEQIKRNNRSLEKFYDAKIIDVRTGLKVSGIELNNGRSTRNKNKNPENLRACRGEKISKGRRSIRKQRYFYQSRDLVRYQGQILTVKGTQNKGKYVALKEIRKVIRVDLLIPYIFRKGFV